MKKTVLVTIVVLFWPLDAIAYKSSSIIIANYIGEDCWSNWFEAGHTDLEPVSDGCDTWDVFWPDDLCVCEDPAGECECHGFVYSKVQGGRCQYDYRPCDSNEPFQLRLFTCDTFGTEQTNRLFVDYLTDEDGETFGDKSLVFVSDRLIFGYAVDIRVLVEEIGTPFGGGWIDLENVPIGILDYASATLHIGTKLLSDINNDEVCNFSDFSELAASWGQPQGKYRGDISGPDHVPDGFVDLYDLAEITHEWLNDT